MYSSRSRCVRYCKFPRIQFSPTSARRAVATTGVDRGRIDRVHPSTVRWHTPVITYSFESRDMPLEISIYKYTPHICG